jgi:type I restriction enzyme S subunit
VSWDQVPLGYCVTEVKKKNTGGREDNLLSLSYGNIIRRDIATADGLLPESFDSYNVVFPGDTVLRLTDLQNDQRSLRVGLVEEVGIITSAYVTVRPNKVLHPQFLNYFLKHMDFRKDFYALGAGVRQSLKFDELRSVKVPVPALADQKAIADYLDRETARIDALIETKLKLMRLVDERISNQLIGMFATDSVGVPLKYLADILPGYAFSSEDFSEDGNGPILLRGVNLNPGKFNYDEILRFRHEQFDSVGYELVSGDVVIGMDRPFVSGGTRVAIVDSRMEGALLVQRVCRLRFQDRDLATIASIALSSDQFKQYIESDLSGVSVPHLSDSQIGAFKIKDLRLGERRSAVSEIEQSMKFQSEILTKLDSQIGYLREHRQALITTVVTGELEIAEVAA